jgi:hypothetical protein
MREIKKSILAGLSFGVLFGLFFAIRFSFEQAIYVGPISGLFFGIAIYYFATSRKVKLQTQIENENMDKIIHSGAANHFINGEAVGGRLYLLTDRIQFKSHNFNISNHELKIDLEQIQQMNFFNTLGLIPNGFEIQTLNGRIEKFVVDGRKQWREEIEKLKTGHNNGEYA